MPDYIPERETELLDWLDNFATQAAAMAGSLPLSPELVAALQEAKAAAAEAHAAHTEARLAAKAARGRKDRVLREATQRARAAVQLLQADPAVTDTQRRTLGVPVHDRIRTPAAAPKNSPWIRVEHSERFAHRLVIRDPTHGNRRAKPAGALGCEVWMALAPPPGLVAAGPGEGFPAEGRSGAAGDGSSGSGAHSAAAAGSEHSAGGDAGGSAMGSMALLGITTSGLFEQVFKPEQIGWTAIYRARWFTRRGDKSPWSEAAEATVAG